MSKMANQQPRKFQEKIALIIQRENEGNLEYEKIMKECEVFKSNSSNVSFLIGH